MPDLQEPSILGPLASVISPPERDDQETPPQTMIGPLANVISGKGPDWVPEHLQEQYQTARQEVARTPESRLSYWTRNINMFGVPGLIDDTVASRARERIRTGTPEPEDFHRLAIYERNQSQSATEETGQKIATTVAKLPAIALEFWLGGAVAKGAGAAIGFAPRAASKAPTLLGRAGEAIADYRAWRDLALQTATTPSMYLPKFSQVNQEGGRDPLSLAGLPTAFAHGMLNMAVLGSAAEFGANIPGNSIPAFAHRLAVKVGLGMAEQQAVDVAASVVSHALSEGYKLDTGYGLLGDAIQAAMGKKEIGDVFLHAATQAVTFAGFALMHGNRPGDVLESYADALKANKKAGASREAAANRILALNEKLARAGNQGPEVAANLPERTSAERAEKQYAQEVAETVAPAAPEEAQRPETPPEAPNAAQPQGEADVGRGTEPNLGGVEQQRVDQGANAAASGLPGGTPAGDEASGLAGVDRLAAAQTPRPQSKVERLRARQAGIQAEPVNPEAPQAQRGMRTFENRPNTPALRARMARGEMIGRAEFEQHGLKPTTAKYMELRLEGKTMKEAVEEMGISKNKQAGEYHEKLARAFLRMEKSVTDGIFAEAKERAGASMKAIRDIEEGKQVSQKFEKRLAFKRMSALERSAWLMDRIAEEVSNGGVDAARIRTLEEGARAVEDAPHQSIAIARSLGYLKPKAEARQVPVQSQAGRVPVEARASAEAPAQGASAASGPAAGSEAAPVKKTPEQIKAERTQRLLANKPPDTLLDIVKRAGGISREDARLHGFDTKIMEESIPSIFKNQKGTKGTGKIHDLATMLVTEGHMLPEESRYLHQLFHDKIMEKAWTVQADLAKQLEREQAAYQKELADAKAEHSPAEVAEALRQGQEDFSAEKRRLTDAEIERQWNPSEGAQGSAPAEATRPGGAAEAGESAREIGDEPAGTAEPGAGGPRRGGVGPQPEDVPFRAEPMEESPFGGVEAAKRRVKNGWHAIQLEDGTYGYGNDHFTVQEGRTRDGDYTYDLVDKNGTLIKQGKKTGALATFADELQVHKTENYIALRDAVNEHPLSADTRRVFSDFLEEHGLDAMAERQRDLAKYIDRGDASPEWEPKILLNEESRKPVSFLDNPAMKVRIPAEKREAMRPIMESAASSMSNLPAGEQAHFMRALTHVLSRMEPKALEQISKAKPEFQWHSEMDSLKKELQRLDQKRGGKARDLEGKIVGGIAVPRSDGSYRFVLDGGKETGQGEQMTREYYAHELHHAIDGNPREGRLSDSEEFLAAWQKEKASEYAGKNPQEGFAEFGRRLLTGDPAALAAEMPETYKFFLSNGLAPEVEPAGSAKPSEVFSERIPLDNKGGHADLAMPSIEEKDEGPPGRLGALKHRVQEVAAGMKKFATKDVPELIFQKSAPRTTAESKVAGEKVTQFNAAPDYARTVLDQLKEKVGLGKESAPEVREKFGAVVYEARARHMEELYKDKADAADQAFWRARERYQDAENREDKAIFKREMTKAVENSAEYRELAKNQKSFIGDDSPLKTQAEYEAALKSPEFQDFVKRWNQAVEPQMEQNFRRNMGMEENEEIDAETQLPWFKFNMKAVQPGEELGRGVVGLGKGNLKNVRMRKFGFSKQATGQAEAYDVDLGRVLENAMQHGLTTAARKEMIETLISENLAVRGTERQKPEGLREIPGVWPQGRIDKRTSLYVKPEIYSELRTAFKVDEPTKIPGVTEVAGVINAANLAGPMDAIYHTKNLLTLLTKPYVSPAGFARYLVGGGKDVEAKWREIVRIGAGGRKPHEPSVIPHNPLDKIGEGVNRADKAIRLAMNDAYDAMAERGLVDGKDETNRRDFINQSGQYIRESSNKLVQILKDSGLGPFATAGFTFYGQGLRALTMDPGVKATSMKAALELRARMFGRFAMVAGAVAAINYLRWGKATGDENTPLGAIKWGEKDGKTQTWNALDLVTGVTRGARSTGLQAVIEGARLGQRAGRSIDKASEDILHAIIHPAIGPAVSTAWTAATGKDFFGRDVTKDITGSHALDRVLTAGGRANALVGEALNLNRPGEDRSLLGSLSHVLGPFEVKSAALKEVNEIFDRVKDMEERRKREQKAGRRFAEEPAYHRLKQVESRLRKLIVQAKTASPEGKQLIRQAMQRLARTVVG